MSRKRGHDDGSTAGLLSAFEQEAKRSKLDDMSNFNVNAPKQSTARSTFLSCHLKMLRSLYPQEDKLVPTNTWDLIEEFLSLRQSLLSKIQNAQELSGLLTEADSISQKPPLAGPILKRLNSTVKSQSKLSFSFITQSQQKQIHSLSLNSPSASMSPCRPYSYTYAYNTHAYTYSNQKQKQKNANAKIKKFNSMNLVSSILKKKHTTAVNLANTQLEPFSPLLRIVQNVINQLEKDLDRMKLAKKQELEVENMTDRELWLAAECLGEDTEDNEQDDDDGNDNNYNDDDMAIHKSRLGLWNALGMSLNHVLAVKL